MRFLTALLVTMFLNACATTTTPPSPVGAFIAPGVFFVLPQPHELGYPVEAVQLVTASYRGERFLFEAHISASPSIITLVSIDSLGRRALTATRTAEQLTADVADWVPKQVRAENILVDLAIAYWPERAVRDGLEGTTAALISHGNARSILVNGREIVHVDYEGAAVTDPWVGRTRLRNDAFGYTLELRSARVVR